MGIIVTFRVFRYFFSFMKAQVSPRLNRRNRKRFLLLAFLCAFAITTNIIITYQPQIDQSISTVKELGVNCSDWASSNWLDKDQINFMRYHYSKKKSAPKAKPFLSTWALAR